MFFQVCDILFFTSKLFCNKVISLAFPTNNLFKTNIGEFQFAYTLGKFMFKVNNRSTTIRCEICSKLTIKTPVSSSVFIVKSKHISLLVLVVLLLTLSR